jgi:hypothetical protein
MSTNEFSVYEVVGIVFITSFAIQQVLEILDPGVIAAIAKYMAFKKSPTPPEKPRLQRFKNLLPELPPEGMTYADFKKSWMYLLGFILGLFVVGLTGIKLLYYVRSEWGGGVTDIVVTALVIGSGSEATNTVLKLFGYLKDSQNPAWKFLETSITIIPPEKTVPSQGTYQFEADVKNVEDKSVSWDVVEGEAGGTIDQSGLYTGPGAPGGPYRVRAISNADRGKQAVATVRVT